MPHRFRVLSLGCAAALFLAAAHAAAAEIHVLSTNAPQQAERQLAEQFSKVAGDKVEFTFASPPDVLEKLKAGPKPDIVVMPTTAIDTLQKDGFWSPGSRTDLVRVGIGVAMRRGAAAPDISTPEAFRKLLLDARSIVYADPRGGSGILAQRIVSQAGVADAVGTKVAFLGPVPGMERIAKGEAELGLYNVSEIMVQPGVAMIGAVPAPWEVYTSYAAVVPAATASPERALAFIKYLSRPESGPIWSAAGLQPAPWPR
jgi:molybdate transport system substrate-binding protein